jgi:hypothetical protein
MNDENGIANGNENVGPTEETQSSESTEAYQFRLIPLNSG